MFRTIRSIIGVTFALIATAAMPVRAADLIGVDFFGMLYDVTDSGVTSNPRNTNINTLSGIAFGANNVLYGIDAATDHLWQINLQSGASSSIGFLGLDVTEGDLAFRPTTGTLYGVQTFGADRLYTIDPLTGAGTVVGTIVDGGDISAIAFTPAGSLFALDTFNELLYEVDPLTASITQTYSLGSVSLGGAAGMVYDPETGFFIIADGGPNGTNQMYVYATSLGFAFPVGVLDVPNGLSGLTYIPEPSAGTLTLLLTCFLCYRRRRDESGR